MSKRKSYNILVSLDSLLDTRLATLERINPDLVSKNLESNYHSRTSDSFEGISLEEFKLAYSKRDKETLKVSIMTNMVKFLSILNNEILFHIADHPIYDNLTIDVNLYPYELTKEEQELMIEALKMRIYGEYSLNMVSISDEDLTVSKVKNDYHVLIMYDYSNWMEVNTEGFETLKIPEVDLFVPAISFTQPLGEDVKEFEKELNDQTLFEFIKSHLSIVIGYNPTDIYYYSLYSPDDIQRKEKT